MMGIALVAVWYFTPQPVQTDLFVSPQNAKKVSAQLKNISILRANRPTLLAVNASGVVYFVQREKNESDTVFEVGQSGVPEATGLSVRNICKELGKPDGKGNIQAMTSLRTGEIIALFNGGTKLDPLVTLVSYEPRSRSITVLYNNDQLAELTNLGRTLELANFSLVRSGDIVYLWVRHPTQSHFYKFDANALNISGKVVLKLAFKSIYSDIRGNLQFDSDATLGGEEDGTFWLVEPTEDAVYHVNRDGQLLGSRNLKDYPTPRVSMVRLRNTKNEPLNYWAYTVSREDVKMNTDTILQTNVDLQIHYPLIIVVNDKKQAVAILTRDNITTRPGFPTYAMCIDQLILDPSTNDLIAYDTMSGELVRITIKGLPKGKTGI